jgi:hypothetical protein
MATRAQDNLGESLKGGEPNEKGGEPNEKGGEPKKT